MTEERKRKIEFGDFQTPDELALQVCERLAANGTIPNFVIEPTCGVGAFLVAAARTFQSAESILGFELNPAYLSRARARVRDETRGDRIELHQADFFAHDWRRTISKTTGHLLVLGNLPWVTNAGLGAIGGTNLPEKSNFLGHTGFDAITGKANFDISEWMLIDVLRWVADRTATVAMLVKTAVARKVLGHAERMQVGIGRASMTRIDAKAHFDASVDACLLCIEIAPGKTQQNLEYCVFESLSDRRGRRVGHRGRVTVSNLELFDRHAALLGESPQKWRSGIKHDASDVMEFTRLPGGCLQNGLGETVSVEPDYLFPLLKGSDVGSAKVWREKFVMVTQRFVGESTAKIRIEAPKTWKYLEAHADRLNGRGSSIYKESSPYGVFGVGEYSFKPWKIAICGLYKKLSFRFVGPIENRPAMFDDTVYFVSFDTKAEATAAYDDITSDPALELLESLVFWDEKRPIKSALLNMVDWSRVRAPVREGEQLLLNVDRPRGMRGAAR